MDYAYRYASPDTIYLNATNRCTNHCSFCVRNLTEGFGEAILWGEEGEAEPDLGMIERAVGAQGSLASFREFVWCGYGEPTFRLDLIVAAAPWLRSRGARIRLNTNGHACLIHGRDVIPELAQAVDEVSISLNAPNRERYVELCRPVRHALPAFPVDDLPVRVWEGVIDFLRRAPSFFRDVQASVVGHALRREEIEESRALARSLGIERFRVR